MAHEMNIISQGHIACYGCFRPSDECPAWVMHGCVLVVTPARRRPVCRGELGACAVFPALTIGHAIAGNDEPARPAGGRVRGPVWRRAATRAGQGGSRDPPRGDDPSHDPRFDSRRRVAVVEAGQEAASGLPRSGRRPPPCPRGRVRCVDPPKCVSKNAPCLIDYLDTMYVNDT